MLVPKQPSLRICVFTRLPICTLRRHAIKMLECDSDLYSLRRNNSSRRATLCAYINSNFDLKAVKIKDCHCHKTSFKMMKMFPSNSDYVFLETFLQLFQSEQLIGNLKHLEEDRSRITRSRRAVTS